MNPTVLILSLVLSLFALTFGEVCKNPVVKPKTYTTTDGMVVSEVSFIAEFSVSCAKNIKDMSLYADIKGKTFPAVKSIDGTMYQVSWTEESSKTPSGTHEIKLYDEEGFAALRKAQRNGEAATNIPSTYSISMYHTGTYYGPWVQSEFLATICSIILWYIAFSARSKLVA